MKKYTSIFIVLALMLVQAGCIRPDPPTDPAARATYGAEQFHLQLTAIATEEP